MPLSLLYHQEFFPHIFQTSTDLIFAYISEMLYSLCNFRTFCMPDTVASTLIAFLILTQIL
jgi:hypothetical protein